MLARSGNSSFVLERQLAPITGRCAALYPKRNPLLAWGIVVEEIDETVFWLELLAESNIIPQRRLGNLQREANELLAIFATSQLTAKGVGSNSSIHKSDNP
jgi:hypothetical protein